MCYFDCFFVYCDGVGYDSLTVSVLTVTMLNVLVKRRARDACLYMGGYLAL